MALSRLEQGRLLMGWIGPGLDSLEDACGLNLLSIILGMGRSSRLVQELREQKQLVYGIESSFSLQRDSSLFTIGAWLAPQHLEILKYSIVDLLEKLRVKPVTKEELTKAKGIYVVSRLYFFDRDPRSISRIIRLLSDYRLCRIVFDLSLHH